MIPLTEKFFKKKYQLPKGFPKTSLRVGWKRYFIACEDAYPDGRMGHRSAENLLLPDRSSQSNLWGRSAEVLHIPELREAPFRFVFRQRRDGAVRRSLRERETRRERHPARRRMGASARAGGVRGRELRDGRAALGASASFPLRGWNHRPRRWRIPFLPRSIVSFFCLQSVNNRAI